MSRIGRQPITLPEKVTCRIDGRMVAVEGPLGKLDWEHHSAADLLAEINRIGEL